MVETIGTAQQIATRTALLRTRIDDAARRSGREPGSVTLIAVTKTMTVETIRAAALAGIRDIGENKVQEASLKRDELLDQVELRWHLIGHLQRNKTRRAIETGKPWMYSLK
jgi:hypothetical protein